jgi:hypothetical protein
MYHSAESKRLSVQGLTHSYGSSNAVSDVSFTIEPGEIVALLGPSGCGKSTVLRAIAGLIQPKAGKIVLGSQDLASVSARGRGIGMVFPLRVVRDTGDAVVMWAPAGTRGWHFAMPDGRGMRETPLPEWSAAALVPAPHDIDLMVLGDPDVEAVYEACTRVESSVHRPVNPTILTPEEFAVTSGFLDSVRSGSAVAVIGELPWH